MMNCKIYLSKIEESEGREVEDKDKEKTLVVKGNDISYNDIVTLMEQARELKEFEEDDWALDESKDDRNYMVVSLDQGGDRLECQIFGLNDLQKVKVRELLGL